MLALVLLALAMGQSAAIATARVSSMVAEAPSLSLAVRRIAGNVAMWLHAGEVEPHPTGVAKRVRLAALSPRTPARVHELSFGRQGPSVGLLAVPPPAMG